MKTTGKKYKTTLAMVKDLSDPEFTRDFEKHMKSKTVYVCYDVDSASFEVFSELKLAKMHVNARLGKKAGWSGNNIEGRWKTTGFWIQRKVVVDHESRVQL